MNPKITNAAIYSYSGELITGGLRPCTRSDHAIIAARAEARERDEDVTLVDADGTWVVHPDGSCEPSPE